MTRFGRKFLVTLALFGPIALVATNAPHAVLQVKRGLWSFRNTITVTGDTVFPDTLKTLPGDRAQHLAELRRMLAQPSGERECLTRASIEHRIFNAGKSCKLIVLSNTPRLLEVLTECHAKIGAFTQDTIQRLVMSSPGSATMSTHSVSRQGGKIMTVDSTEVGHLVSPACGNVHTIEQIP